SPNALAAKAVVVKLGSGAAVAFDTDLLRYAAAWTDGYLDLSKTHLTTPKGSTPLTPKGNLVFETPAVPGDSPDGSFKDPRPRPLGPLPKSYGRYKGLYVRGGRVMLSYRIGDCDVLDVPDYGEFAGRPMFSRTLRLAATKSPHVLVLFQDPAGEPARVMAGIVDPTSTVTLAVDGPRNL